MASRPSPSAERMTRTTRAHGAPAMRAAGGRLGSASRGAERLRSGLGVGLDKRLGRTGAVTVAWGLWRSADDAVPQQLPNLALVRYAETLRRRRGAGRRATPDRGLPLVLRRRGATVLGGRSGPGGLAQALVPVDRPERPDIAAILRDGRRPAAAPVPLPRPRTDRRRER